MEETGYKPWYIGTDLAKCPVCWRSHGCGLPINHEGEHICEPDTEWSCGSPYDWDEPFDWRDFKKISDVGIRVRLEERDAI